MPTGPVKRDDAQDEWALEDMICAISLEYYEPAFRSQVLVMICRSAGAGFDIASSSILEKNVIRDFVKKAPTRISHRASISAYQISTCI